VNYVSTIKESKVSGDPQLSGKYIPVLVISFDTEQQNRLKPEYLRKSKMKGGRCQDNTDRSNWTTIGKSTTNLKRRNSK